MVGAFYAVYPYTSEILDLKLYTSKWGDGVSKSFTDHAEIEKVLKNIRRMKMNKAGIAIMSSPMFIEV